MRWVIFQKKSAFEFALSSSIDFHVVLFSHSSKPFKLLFVDKFTWVHDVCLRIICQYGLMIFYFDVIWGYFVNVEFTKRSKVIYSGQLPSYDEYTSDFRLDKRLFISW